MGKEMKFPYQIKKVTKKCHQVWNKKTRKIFSKCTTKEKASRQKKYLKQYLKKKLIKD
jgi:hypothetical protein